MPGSVITTVKIYAKTKSNKSDGGGGIGERAAFLRTRSSMIGPLNACAYGALFAALVLLRCAGMRACARVGVVRGWIVVMPAHAALPAAHLAHTFAASYRRACCRTRTLPHARALPALRLRACLYAHHARIRTTVPCLHTTHTRTRCALLLLHTRTPHAHTRTTAARTMRDHTYRARARARCARIAFNTTHCCLRLPAATTIPTCLHLDLALAA